MIIRECSLCRNSDNNWQNWKSVYFGKNYAIIRLNMHTRWLLNTVLMTIKRGNSNTYVKRQSFLRKLSPLLTEGVRRI